MLCSAEFLVTSGATLARNLCLTFFVCVMLLTPAFSQIAFPTSRGDNARTGANTAETMLIPANVNKNSFGRLLSLPIDYIALAQPLYMPNVDIPGQGTHNVVYVVTQADSVYAFDADDGTLLWYASMLNGGTTATGSNLPCQYGGFHQEGIIGTPVIDPNTNTMYLVAKTFRNNVVRHDIHALDITTGNDRLDPVQIVAQSTSNSNNKFNQPIVTNFTSLHQKNRPGLLLVNGKLYIGFGGNGCNDSNTGWVLSYDASSLTQLAAFNTSPAYGLTSIWQTGNGLAADDAGNVLFETAEAANSVAVPDGNYDIPNGGQTYCNSVLKLAPDLSVADYFTPYNVFNLNSADFDLSATGVLVLPVQPGSPYPHAIIAGGKQGYIYVLNRDNLGMYSSVSDQIIQEFALVPETRNGVLMASPAYWNNAVYFAPNSSSVRRIPLLPSGLLDIQHQVRTKQAYGGSHSPSISANGNDTSTGIVWVLTAQLFAFDATSMNLLYSTTQAPSNRDTMPPLGHFATQTVANGRVYVATQNSLEVYGLFNSVSVISGDGQSGTVGTALAAPIQVHSASPYNGQVDVDTLVHFSDGCNTKLPTTCGSFNPTSAVTDANGNASTTYTLPQKSGTYTVTFSGIGFSNTTATATATAGTAVKLVPYGGGGQTGADGFILGCPTPNPGCTPGTKPLIVEVLDSYKNPVPGITINFTATKGAVPSPASAVTDATGFARTSLQLPNTPSAITVTAKPAVQGSILPAKGVVFAMHSVAPVATKIAITSGNNQSAPGGTQLSQVLTVLVTDQYGNPFNGNTVSFSDNGAGGTFSNGPTVVTGTDGTASQSYTLPQGSSTITINASASGVSGSAVFTETSVAGPAANIAITGGDNQTAPAGTQMPQALTVLVTDQYGNKVSGVSVTFSDGGSGGSFSNPNPGVTGADGTVSQFYTLPPIGGDTVLITATAAGVTTPVVFTENGQ